MYCRVSCLISWFLMIKVLVISAVGVVGGISSLKRGIFSRGLQQTPLKRIHLNDDLIIKEVIVISTLLQLIKLRYGYNPSQLSRNPLCYQLADYDPDSIWVSRRDIARAVLTPIATKKLKSERNNVTSKKSENSAGKSSFLLSIFIVSIGAITLRLGYESPFLFLSTLIEHKLIDIVVAERHLFHYLA